MELGDRILGVLTLVAVLLVFVYEQWGKWFPFKLLGSETGKYPLPQDPNRITPIRLSGANDQTEFVLRLMPRVGGRCEAISAFFLRTPTLLERLQPRVTLPPTAHYVSPDTIDIREIRILTPRKSAVGQREKTTGKNDIFVLAPSVTFTPGEPVTCVITATVHRRWKGEFSIRPTLEGVTRDRVAVKVEAEP